MKWILNNPHPRTSRNGEQNTQTRRSWGWVFWIKLIQIRTELKVSLWVCHCHWQTVFTMLWPVSPWSGWRGRGRWCSARRPRRWLCTRSQSAWCGSEAAGREAAGGRWSPECPVLHSDNVSDVSPHRTGWHWADNTSWSPESQTAGRKMPKEEKMWKCEYLF